MNRARFLPPGAKVTRLLLISNLVVFTGQLIGLHTLGYDWVGNHLALSRESLAAGEWWQLLTYGWIHSPDFILHITFNMLMLHFLGPILEKELGPKRFLMLYAGGVLMGGCTWLLLNRVPEEAIGGASGAVFTMLMAAGALNARQPIRAFIFFILPVRTTLGRLAWVMLGIEVLFLVIQSLAFFPVVADRYAFWAQHFSTSPLRSDIVATLWASVFQIAHAAHVGGAVFGWLAVHRRVLEHRAYENWLRQVHEELYGPWPAK